MQFNTYLFACFLALVLAIHHAPISWRARTVSLLVASYVFYAAWDPVFVVLLNRDLMKSCSLLAVDLKSGKRLWEAARPDVTQSYGTAVVWKNNGTEEFVMPGSLKLKA